MMRGVHFNGKHSYKDMGLTIASRNIGNPSKVKKKERVPFSNVEYDFSNVYGSQEYTERPIGYTFNIIGWNGSKDSFVNKKIEVINWLMRPSEKEPLYDDTIKGFYFLAEVEDSIELEEYNYDGTITVEFTAYPFKMSELEEGNDIWDEFNFLLDYAQLTDYVVDGRKEITLYNNGITTIKPTIIASAPFEIKMNGVTYEIPKGTTDSYDFVFDELEIIMEVTGNGTISFRYYKEVI